MANVSPNLHLCQLRFAVGWKLPNQLNQHQFRRIRVTQGLGARTETSKNVSRLRYFLLYYTLNCSVALLSSSIDLAVSLCLM